MKGMRGFIVRLVDLLIQLFILFFKVFMPGCPHESCLRFFIYWRRCCWKLDRAYFESRNEVDANICKF